MELILTCLSAIELVFVIMYFTVPIFLRIDRAVVHRLVMNIIIFVSYFLEMILRIREGQTVGLITAAVVVWGYGIFSAISQVKRINKLKKKMEEDQL